MADGPPAPRRAVAQRPDLRRRRRDLSLLFVTHDLAVVRSIADRVVVLSTGRVVEAGPTEQVLAAPSHDYTRRLLADTLAIPAAGAPPARSPS
jgi:peptide/nickel transport system ATP-binding protein